MAYLTLFFIAVVVAIIIKKYIYLKSTDQSCLEWFWDLHCKKKVLFLLDILLFMIYFGIYNRYGFSLILFSNMILTSILLVISIIDIKIKIIPNKLLILGIGIGIIMIFFNDNISIISALLGCVICGGLIGIISIVTKGSIGLGDAKLLACVGIWFGLQTTLGIMLISTILSGLVGLILLTFKRVNRKTTMPFAPYIFVATIFVMVCNFYT